MAQGNGRSNNSDCFNRRLKMEVVFVLLILTTLMLIIDDLHLVRKINELKESIDRLNRKRSEDDEQIKRTDK